MFCEPWRQALSSSAVSGEEPPREARLHLAACGGCRSAFAQEQQLFAGIDHGMQTIANTESPTSLVPRVRAAIAQPNARAPWRIPVWAFAGAALLLIFAIGHKWARAPLSLEPPQTAEAIPSVPASSTHGSSPEIVAPTVHRAMSPEFHSVRVDFVRRGPEVLVSGDEQANLLLYLNRMRLRNVNNAAPLIVAGDAQIKPLEIARIDVPELTIEPLENGDSR